MHAVDLARWGHWQPGMPWELEPSRRDVANVSRNSLPRGLPSECRLTMTVVTVIIYCNK